MNVLLIGSGGREHAFAWKMAQSPHLESFFIAPGNGGTADFGENINLNPNDFNAVGDFCLKNKIGMVVVGPEEPLVLGIHDYFLNNPQLREIPLIGPNKSGARLEGSKAFSKQFMERHSIPTASYGTFVQSQEEEAFTFLQELSPPFVLKADGLAAGKGVLILNDPEEAKREIKEMISGRKFGKAGSQLVIEEFLDGIELSVFVLTDGKDYLILPEAKDYKRIGEGDSGLNTGGMGAVSPVPFAGKDFMQKVEMEIIKPTILGLQKDGIEYSGFIFIGLMNVNGNPFVIEYNCRMGDPETEVVIPRIESDLVELFMHVGNKTLGNASLTISQKTAATVMLVSGGYPGDYEKGKAIILGKEHPDSLVFHAGTRENLETGNLETSGGRVISITSMGDSLEEALNKCYQTESEIQFEGKYCRKDIGKDLRAYLDK